MTQPRGNPEIAKYHFQTKRKEPCTAHISLRVPPSLEAKLKEQENWQEFVRQTLAEKLELESA